MVGTPTRGLSSLIAAHLAWRWKISGRPRRAQSNRWHQRGGRSSNWSNRRRRIRWLRDEDRPRADAGRRRQVAGATKDPYLPGQSFAIEHRTALGRRSTSSGLSWQQTEWTIIPNALFHSCWRLLDGSDQRLPHFWNKTLCLFPILKFRALVMSVISVKHYAQIALRWVGALSPVPDLGCLSYLE